MTSYLRRVAPALWIVLLFLLEGLAFIRKTGMHYDASYELACFYKCAGVVYTGKFGPVMVIPYLGALKAWLYLPILQYLEITPFVVRLPLLLTACGSVWMAFALLDRISGRRAAIAGSLMLATDSVFVIISTYDFGPVVLLHFCLLAGLLLLLRFDRTRSPGWLSFAFFVFGLALWHKALFLWMLAGAGGAALVVAPGRIRAHLSPKVLLVAAASMCLGALPLIYYNVVTGGATLRTSAVVSGASTISQKLWVLRETLDGTVLYGWLTEEAHPETAKAPVRLAARVSDTVSRLTDGMRWHLILPAFVLSLLAFPWLWFTPSRRQALFVVVYLAITWIAMALLPNTGGAVHHVILLWPFPHFLIAIALAQVSYRAGTRGRVLLVCAVSVLVGANWVVMNHYYADLVTRGSTSIFTEATSPLFTYLSAMQGRQVVTTDWGYAATLCLLSDGSMPAIDASAVLVHPSPAELTWLGSLITDSSSVFVNHPQEDEVFPGTSQRLNAIAAREGYKNETLAVIADKNGRPRFEVVQFVPAPAAAQHQR